MSTPYVDIVDARIDPDSPGDYNLTTDIRNDLRHLYERANQVGVDTLESIHDNFTGNTINSVQGTPGLTDYPVVWELPTGAAADVPTMSANPDHYAQVSAATATHFSVLAASKYKMRFDLDRDHTIYCEMRHKSGVSAAADTWLFGFQDETVALSSATAVTTQDNIIAFVQDASANKYKARCVKATVPVDVATAQGNAANWTVLRIEITFSGATKKVEFFVDGTSVGSTTDTAKIPVVRMRPFIGFKTAAGGAGGALIDYADFSWTARPLST